jgi:exopolysaccharide biosynthesis polyprenyl glycosylphosphotransferase
MRAKVARTARFTKPPRPAWIRHYTWRLVLTDSIAIVIAVAGSHLLWFGTRAVPLASTLTVPRADADLQVTYFLVSGALVLAWLAILKFFGTRDQRIVGSGLTEYARTADAAVRLFGLVAIVALLLNVSVARGYIITALPIGLFLILFGRWSWRQWLRERRYKGFYLVRVLIVGSVDSVASLATELRRHAYAGYSVVGFLLTDSADDQELKGFGVPVLRGIPNLLETIAAVDSHAVALAASEGLPPRTVRSISWQLEKTGVDMMLAPSLTDIAGTRIHTRPVAGLPLIYVESPRYEGGAKAVKTIFDFSVALLLTIILSPILWTIAVVIKLSSRGSAFFSQERVGLNGATFNIIKFRTMRNGADAELAKLLEEQAADGRPLFKVKDDPRVTGPGRFLRNTSLDELPQLFNVLRGEMSLVGPRPQVPAEVALYDKAAERRLLVKPGITGLWQISGRSNLSWEEAVRLDLYYVENWSLTDDLVILLRTARVVFLRVGAR